MSDPEPHERYRISRALESADREIRMHSLREHLRSRRGACRADRDDEDAQQSFLERVIRFERAPETTLAKLLLEDGIALPNPGELRTDAEAEEKLWEVINALAIRSVYLYHTNHLSDRELYEVLWRVHLNEKTKDLSKCRGSAVHVDILGGGTREDDRLYLKFFADDAERAYESRNWPADEMPERCHPPYDRDRHLPKHDYP